MQNERTELLASTFKPEISIVVYKSDKEYYLESHNISDDGQVMEGKPLQQQTLQAMVDVFFDERKNMATFTGLIPENLLAMDLLPGGNYRMIWYRPAETRVMHFASQLKLKTGKTNVPAMIYKAERNSLDVFALNKSERPKDKTKIYIAPFFNVSDEGDVCLGDAKVQKPKEKTYAAIMKYWEDLFWLSEFTHINGDDKKTKTDLYKLWKRLLASKGRLKWESLDELKPLRSWTLQNILR